MKKECENGRLDRRETELGYVYNIEYARNVRKRKGPLFIS